MIQPVRSFMEDAKDAIFDSLALILGLTATQAENQIRFSWDKESAKFIATQDNGVCYIRLSLVDKPATGYINIRHGVSTAENKVYEEQDVHICIHADYIFYGANATQNAMNLEMNIFSQGAHDILSEKNLAPIPHRVTKNYVPELVDGAWFERCDVGIDFYMLVEYSGDVDAIVTPPEINIDWR